MDAESTIARYDVAAAGGLATNCVVWRLDENAIGPILQGPAVGADANVVARNERRRRGRGDRDADTHISADDVPGGGRLAADYVGRTAVEIQSVALVGYGRVAADIGSDVIRF